MPSRFLKALKAMRMRECSLLESNAYERLFIVYRGIGTEEKLVGLKKLSDRIRLCIVVQSQNWMR